MTDKTTSIAENLKVGLRESSRAYRAVCTLLVVLVLLGIYAFIRQTVDGHALTGLTNLAPWGLYIAGFVFFVGASAGATIIGLMVHAFKREDYAPLATRALLVGLLSLAVAVTFIMVDVGKINRAVMMPWIHRNFTSMFNWTAITYYLFGIILLAELYFTVKLNRGTATQKDKAKAKWLAIAAVPFALAVLHAPHGALFAVIKAREFWNNPLLPPHFAVVALVSGTALMILVAVLTAKLRGRDLVSKKTLDHMGWLLFFFIATAGLMDFFDFLVFTYSDMAEGNAATHFLSGPHLPLSILHVGGYIVAFFLLISKKGRQIPRLTWAAALTLIAVAAYRFNLVVVGLGVPLLPFFRHDHYAPTVIEYLIAIGVISGGLLAYLLLVKALPMEEDEPLAKPSEVTTPQPSQPGGPMEQPV